MIGFIISRLIQAIAALLLLSVLAFAMTRATGSPLDLILPPEATAEDVVRLEKALGLDRPLPIQYGIYVADLLQGRLGESLRSGEDVATLLNNRFLGSAALSLTAIGIAFLIGLPLGVLAAQSRGTAVDAAVRLAALIGQSVPAFVVGLLLIQIFAVNLKWLPAGTDKGPLAIILPAFTLALFGIAAVTRLLRSAMLEVLDSDYVTLARTKGLPERTVIWKHALRNALLPVVSFAGLLFVSFVSTTIVVETVFAWPGLGSLAYTAILNRDFPVTQGVVLLGAAIAIFVNFWTDVLYAVLDPRIRSESR